VSMKTSGITAAAAEDALVRVAQHVPATVAIERPLIAVDDGEAAVHILSGEDERLEFWTVWPDRAERLVPLPEGRAEVVCWRHGRETSRHIGLVD
jgi:hypothetical protein